MNDYKQFYRKKMLEVVSNEDMLEDWLHEKWLPFWKAFNKTQETGNLSHIEKATEDLKPYEEIQRGLAHLDRHMDVVKPADGNYEAWCDYHVSLRARYEHRHWLNEYVSTRFEDCPLTMEMVKDHHAFRFFMWAKGLAKFVNHLEQRYAQTGDRAWVKKAWKMTSWSQDEVLWQLFLGNQHVLPAEVFESEQGRYKVGSMAWRILQDWRSPPCAPPVTWGDQSGD